MTGTQYALCETLVLAYKTYSPLVKARFKTFRKKYCVPNVLLSIYVPTPTTYTKLYTALMLGTACTPFGMVFPSVASAQIAPAPAVSPATPAVNTASISNIPATAFVGSISSSSTTVVRPRKTSRKILYKKNRSISTFSLFTTSDNSAATEIEMFAGESRVFPAPGVARIAVGNGQVMNAAALDNKEVLVFANAVGTSSLFVWNKEGRSQRIKIHIVPGETSRFAREVAAFLSSIPNAKTSIIGDKVVVEGDQLTDLDLAKIEELSKRYPQIVNFTNRLGWEQMVLIDVKVVEFPSKELREIGLKWNATGGGAIGGIWSPARRGTDGPYQINVQSSNAPITNPTGEGSVSVPSGLNVLSAINMGLNAQLNLLAHEGKAAILAQPQLSARNGAKATFLAGGEYPYTVSTINGQTVLFKSYGIKLDIQPRVDRNGTIRASIESEVSTIDASFNTAAGPALRSRRTTTEFNVKAGDTIVLSGLLTRESARDLDKVPLLGDVPVLGALFRSKRYQNDETELVVFVTPTIVDSRTPEMVDRVQQATQRLEQESGKTPAFLAPIVPHVSPQPVQSNTPTVSSPPNANTASPVAATALASSSSLKTQEVKTDSSLSNSPALLAPTNKAAEPLKTRASENQSKTAAAINPPSILSVPNNTVGNTAGKIIANAKNSKKAPSAKLSNAKLTKKKILGNSIAEKPIAPSPQPSPTPTVPAPLALNNAEKPVEKTEYIEDPKPMSSFMTEQSN
ncbi:MAG: pilus assembly protein N-terminal domain-containing protein [Pseudomonadota bacterium]